MTVEDLSRLKPEQRLQRTAGAGSHLNVSVNPPPAAEFSVSLVDKEIFYD
jgi:hypothetical protein